MKFRIKDFEYVFPEEKMDLRKYTAKEGEKIFQCGLLEMHKRKATAELKAGKKKAQVKKILDNWKAPGKTPKERSLEAKAKSLTALPPDELETVLKLAGRAIPTPQAPHKPVSNAPARPVTLRTEATLTQDTPQQLQSPVDRPAMTDRERRASIAKARVMASSGANNAVKGMDAVIAGLAREAQDDDDLRDIEIPD
jgi:hypothetical protein